MSKSKVRNLYIERIRNDLLGPINGINEEIKNKEGPDKEYLTGKIYPQNFQHSDQNENNDLDMQLREEVQGPEDKLNSDSNDQLNEKEFIKPSSCGLTFFVEEQDEMAFNCKLSYGKYVRNKDDKKYVRSQEELIHQISIKREEHEKIVPVNDDGELFIRASSFKNFKAISIYFVNKREASRDDGYVAKTQMILFQFGFEITGINSPIVPFPKDNNFVNSSTDNDFLYRYKKTYSIGHNCSSSWIEDNQTIAVRTEWIPQYHVEDVDPEGGENFEEVFLAKTFAEKIDLNLLEKCFVKNYKKWIKAESTKIEADYTTQSEPLVAEAQQSANRIKKSIDFLRDDKDAYQAFQYANEALELSSMWSRDGQSIAWRPFQLGFVLLSLESTLNEQSKDREAVDLLWFPTGGGKTEAYFLLLTTLLYYRKLKLGGLDSKDGTAFFTRYTLRALTIDQFKRLSDLLLAAEYVRRKHLNISDNDLVEKTSFSAGLWIGGDATPNTLEIAKKDISKCEIYKKCPCCKHNLKVVLDQYSSRTKLMHEKEINDCTLASVVKRFPIYVIDEEIYNSPPSVVLGTVDKFVQIIRKPDKVGALFGGDRMQFRLPDLILQDELHLISGPLGSLSGAVEQIIDLYASSETFKPKVIGSTATIKQAAEQIKGVFGRASHQFPTYVSSVDDSYYSVAKKDSPGRTYLGITTACSSSATFTLQALSAILLQTLNQKDIQELPNKDKDPYSTLVVYFNALRVLGGARVMLQEDTVSSIKTYAKRREEEVRKFDAPYELTGQIDQEELEGTLRSLEAEYGSQDHINILLASVMISVGLDISRLGLMVVDGQPKTIAEYIQSTSRVGRGSIPGLVLTLFNEFKARDKAHYESFIDWHQSLYRYVEPTSVTPYSPRAREKTLPGVFITYCLKELGKEGDHKIDDEEKKEILESILPKFLQRVSYIDDLETLETKTELKDIVDLWADRSPNINTRWSDKMNELNSLFTSAEKQANRRDKNLESLAFVAPNTARDVESGVTIKVPFQGSKS